MTFWTRHDRNLPDVSDDSDESDDDDDDDEVDEKNAKPDLNHTEKRKTIHSFYKNIPF